MLTKFSDMLISIKYIKIVAKMLAQLKVLPYICIANKHKVLIHYTL